MAVVTGPLLSFGASGQIGKTQVYSRWKGRPYVRRLVIPANPRSTEQVKTRSTFTWLSNVWRVAPARFVAPWTQFARGQVLTNRNAFFQKNLGLLRNAADLTGIVLSPGASGGLFTAPVITGGAGTITIDFTAPSPLPAGWSIVSAIGVAILDQDAQLDDDYTIYSGQDDTSTYQVVLSGLTAGDYKAGGWFVYQRSLLSTDLAYGASIGETVVVT